MKYRFTPLALSDIAAIAGYLHERNPAAAVKVRAAIHESLQQLVLFPLIGRQQNLPGVRKWIVRKYPYLLYYKFDESAEEIIILTIQHPAEQRSYDDAE